MDYFESITGSFPTKYKMLSIVLAYKYEIGLYELHIENLKDKIKNNQTNLLTIPDDLDSYKQDVFLGIQEYEIKICDYQIKIKLLEIKITRQELLIKNYKAY